MESYSIRIQREFNGSEKIIYHVTSDIWNETCRIVIRQECKNEHSHYICVSFNLTDVAQMSKNHLAEILNDNIKKCMMASDIVPVTEDEAWRIIKAAKCGRASESGWLKVCRFVGMEGYPGQGNIELVWKYICFDTEHQKYVSVSESKNWSYCSPNLNIMQASILNHEPQYFYSSLTAYNGYCDGNIATADIPITESLVLDEILNLPSSKINTDVRVSEGNTADDANKAGFMSGIKSIVNNKKIDLSQELTLAYPPSFVGQKSDLEVYLDGNELKFTKNKYGTVIIDTEFDNNAHMLELKNNDFYKKIGIPRGKDNKRSLKVFRI